MEWLSIVLGGGGLAFVLACGKGIQWLYEGRQNRAAKLLDQLEQARDEAEDRLRHCRTEIDFLIELANYWRIGRAIAEAEAERGGVTISPMAPLPERPNRGVPEV